MKRFGGQPKIHFDEKELNTDLGTENFNFVGSSCDMWAENIPQEWIDRTLWHCLTYDNKYLFQSKNPSRFFDYIKNFPPESILGTAIETNRSYPEMGVAPPVSKRAHYMNKLSAEGFETFLTIEPIMDFILDGLLPLAELCRPKFVNIGADSGGHKLPEPPAEKVLELIAGLSKFTEVKIKKNLKRIMGCVWGQMPKKS